MSKKTLTRDALADALRIHQSEIVDAEEWRPLAQHVLELAKLGYLPREDTLQIDMVDARWLINEAIKCEENSLPKRSETCPDHEHDIWVKVESALKLLREAERIMR